MNEGLEQCSSKMRPRVTSLGGDGCTGCVQEMGMYLMDGQAASKNEVVDEILYSSGPVGSEQRCGGSFK